MISNDRSPFDYHLDLRFEREIRGISIESFAKETKFSVSQLKKFEAGHYDAFSDRLVVRGLLKIYTQKLGLDPDIVMLEFHHISNRPQTASKTVVMANPPITLKNSIQILVPVFVIAVGMIFFLALRTVTIDIVYNFENGIESHVTTDYITAMAAFETWFQQGISLDDDTLEAYHKILTLPINAKEIYISALTPTWMKVRKIDSGTEIMKGLFPGNTEMLSIDQKTLIWFDKAGDVQVSDVENTWCSRMDDFEMIHFIPD